MYYSKNTKISIVKNAKEGHNLTRGRKKNIRRIGKDDIFGLTNKKKWKQSSVWIKQRSPNIWGIEQIWQ